MIRIVSGIEARSLTATERVKTMCHEVQCPSRQLLEDKKLDGSQTLWSIVNRGKYLQRFIRVRRQDLGLR